MNKRPFALLLATAAAVFGCDKPPKNDSPPPTIKTEQIESKGGGTPSTRTSVPLPGK